MRHARGPSRKKAAQRKALPARKVIQSKSGSSSADQLQARAVDRSQQRRVRDDLISKARYGKITAEQAEDEAQAAGLAPLASRPPAAEFDPMKESRWTLLQAIAWVAWRDSILVMEQNQEYRSRYTCWFFRPWKEPDGTSFKVQEGWFLEPLCPSSALYLALQDCRMRAEGDLPASARFTTREAEAELWKALLADSLKAEGFDKSGSPVEIPARDWAHLKMYEERGQPVLKYKALDVPPAFTEIRFKRADVTSIWPRSVDPDTLDLGNITEQHFELMLSDAAYVPFSVAVCWVATKGGRKLVSMRDEMEWKRSAKILLSGVSASQIGIIGCGDDQEGRQLPATAFDSVDCPHPYSIDIRYLFAEQTHVRCFFPSNDEGWKSGYDDQFFLEGRRRPHWTRLRLRRDQVLKLQPKLILKANLEVECRNWLEGLMRLHSKRPKSKPDLMREAKANFSGLGKRQSERAWADAINATGNTEWTKKGPVRKV
jgi:hypothetical protein